ncbi:MAG TPA: indolepyruvate ferredoxin oxidoreductase subunit alpha [Candidatus Paceibacterota bacterium]|nr:indolepyruvate ferredoxin oxidoreductase subunit alpha [Verrucomicrobiota bacterium]HRY47908.1 indolepyruvate ferredoxin oxidoreductase subunit alpha [Candidatus Paceibacterota bacterium]
MLSTQHNHKVDLLSGNEAIARGAFEAGVAVACGYPGTPSTEILEAVATYKPALYCEWSPNEKVAFEVAVGASLSGARSIVTMKHVGLNVAADPLMTFSYVGAVGGMVACVADDPGMHSSQNEQDTRHYARLAKVPLFEPADSQEAKDFLKIALDVSEQFQTPILLRLTTRVSHSRGLVTLLEDRKPAAQPGFVKDPPRYVPIPMWGRLMRHRVEERLPKLIEAAEQSPLNRIEMRDPEFGIVTSSIAYQYVRDVFPEASVLKLGWSYPFPDKVIRQFAGQVKRILVVEELDDFLEEHIKALGIACEGRNIVPGIGELTPSRLRQVKARLEGREPSAIPTPTPVSDLPARPPVLCPGCPHRGIFYALTQFDVVVTGDIGCYSLGVFPPLNRMDTILCMGAGVSMPQGFEKAGEPKKIVGMVGDSTFFHSGITGLLNIVHNRGASTIVVVDNRTTAMTGHQDNPGTEYNLMGEVTPAISIEAIARACGVRRVETVNPYELERTIQVFKEALEAKEATVIVSRAPCPLHEGKPVGKPLAMDASVCQECGECLNLGCPAVEKREGHGLHINDLLCGGCGMCAQVCPFAAISPIQTAQS